MRVAKLTPEIELHQPDVPEEGTCHYCGQHQRIFWHFVGSADGITSHCCKKCSRGENESEGPESIVPSFPGAFFAEKAEKPERDNYANADS